MYWLMICRHKPDAWPLARAAPGCPSPACRDGRRRRLPKVLIGSALTEDDGETPIGNFGVLEAPSREAAQAFAENDPYARAGIVESIEITALASRFQAHGSIR